MKKLLLFLLLLPGIAQAQFGSGANSGFGQNFIYAVEHGTFAVSGEWTFDPGSTVVLPPTTVLVGGTTVATSTPLEGDGLDGSPVTLTLCAEGEIVKVTGGVWACTPDGGSGGGSGGGAHTFYRDDFTSLADGVETDFVMQSTPADNSAIISLNGIVQREGTDFTIGAENVISFVTAPINETTSLLAVYPSSVPVANLDGQTVMSVGVAKESNGATYEVLKEFIYAGSDIIGSPVRLLSNEFRLSGGGTCDFRIYDLTNAQTIHETTGLVGSPTFIENTTDIANIPTSPAIWEIQAKRNGGGTTCRVETVELLWR